MVATILFLRITKLSLSPWYMHQFSFLCTARLSSSLLTLSEVIPSPSRSDDVLGSCCKYFTVCPVTTDRQTDEISSFYGENIICDSDHEALNRLE